MENVKVNYIIGGWLPGRRSGVVSGEDLFDWQLRRLNELKHNLNKIYYAVPLDGFQKGVLEPIIAKYPRLNVEVMITGENLFSHGSWNYCMKKTCDEADFTILVEDDYIPAIDNIDDVFLEYFDNEKVGYVCQQRTELPEYPPTPGAILENGMVRNKAFKECGGFKIVGKGYYNASLTQACFLEYIINGGYTVKDTMDKYNTYYNRSGRINQYGNLNGKEIFRPIECELYNCAEYIATQHGMDEHPYVHDRKPLESKEE